LGWGWKPASRCLAHVRLENAVAVLTDEGFETDKRGGDYALLKKRGRKRGGGGRAAPLDAKLFVEPEGDAVEMRLAYDMFVVFDTGDLGREADRLEQAIAPPA